MSGPAPNPQSRKQSGNQAHTWTDLPVDGYRGKIPRWPLTDAATKDEAAMWRRIWRTPHAAAWQRLGWHDDVATYVRLMIRGTRDGRVDIKALGEARLWSDRLGLNPTAMLRNRWRVRSDEVAEARTAGVAAKARRRFAEPDDALART